MRLDNPQRRTGGWIRRWPPWIVGGIAGAGFWVLVIAAHPTLRFLERRHDFFATWLPASLMRMGWLGLDVDILQLYVERASSPISGEWMERDAVVGLGLYIAVSAVIFTLFSMTWRRRYALRTLVILMTLVAISLGILVVVFR